MSAPDFEWDALKAAANLRKLGVSFHEAREVIRIISARKANPIERAQYSARRLQ